MSDKIDGRESFRVVAMIGGTWYIAVESHIIGTGIDPLSYITGIGWVKKTESA